MPLPHGDYGLKWALVSKKILIILFFIFTKNISKIQETNFQETNLKVAICIEPKSYSDLIINNFIYFLDEIKISKIDTIINCQKWLRNQDVSHVLFIKTDKLISPFDKQMLIKNIDKPTIFDDKACFITKKQFENLNSNNYQKINNVLTECDINICGRTSNYGSVTKLPLIAEKMLCNKMLTKSNYNLKTNASILFQPIWQPNVKIIPMQSKINIAYSMFESDQIPQEWVDELNKLDVIILPDQWLEDVYKKSGVKKPIFIIPCLMDMHELLEIEKTITMPIKNKEEFIFGCSAVMEERKNIELLIRAFNQAFKNNNNYKLIIHSKSNLNKEKIENLITSLAANNIELLIQRMNKKDYVFFLKSLDCYVLISSGEGFSLTPREAIVLNVPCLISNNTGHTTIADAKVCTDIKCIIKKKAFSKKFKRQLGYQYYPELIDVSDALINFTENYLEKLKLTKRAYDWVQQYDLKNIADEYRMIIKPKKIILGKNNIVTKDYLETNNLNLYKLYKKTYNFI